MSDQLAMVDVQAMVLAIGVELGMALERQALGLTADSLKRFAKMSGQCDDLARVDPAAGSMCRAKVMAALHGGPSDVDGHASPLIEDLPVIEAAAQEVGS